LARQLLRQAQFDSAGSRGSQAQPQSYCKRRLVANRQMIRPRRQGLIEYKVTFYVARK
jgi:hypothetical protein